MGFDLYVGPRRKQTWRWVWLAGLILLGAGLIAWQQGWRPDQAVIGWVQEFWQSSPLPLAALPVPEPLRTAVAPVQPVIRSTTRVIDSPHSPAYTGELYTPSAGPAIPWPNVGGRTRVLTYTVESGDTLWTIALEFELALDTLRWSNPELEQNPDLLPIGSELIILPVDGVYHRVSEGDTIETIAARYGIQPADIVDYPPNGLYQPYRLEAGRGLIVPFGRK